MALVTFRTAFGVIAAVVGLASCGGGSGTRQEQPAPPPPVTAIPEVPKQALDDRPVIVAFGDSLSAGYGLEAGLSYPDFLQKILDSKKIRYRVVNQGLSGDTTTGGVSRIDQCIALKPEIVLLELGGNDGLRGIPVSNMRANLETMIRKLKDSGATVVLVGITLPRNYGDDYIKGFEKAYSDLARQYNLTHVPFLLEGVYTPAGGVPGMIQDDGIHPTAKGTPIMARTIFKTIEPLLRH